MLTEESRLKRYVSKRLKELGCYYHMPVPSGYGRQGLDYFVCLKGRFLGIETKAKGKEPTARQWQCMEEIVKAGGIAFACDSVESFEATMALHGLTSVQSSCAPASSAGE